jgi:hypothetical protein
MFNVVCHFVSQIAHSFDFQNYAFSSVLGDQHHTYL